MIARCAAVNAMPIAEIAAAGDSWLPAITLALMVPGPTINGIAIDADTRPGLGSGGSIGRRTPRISRISMIRNVIPPKMRNDEKWIWKIVSKIASPRARRARTPRS
jgi:hypothetical protein